MIVSHLALKNWRNFRTADAFLRKRVFLVGPNASGKSNLLDSLRFLRDIAKPEGGGLQKAMAERGGFSKIRCLASQGESPIEVDVQLSESYKKPAVWRYCLGVAQESGARGLAVVRHERVWKNGDLILDRPDEEDTNDRPRLYQTHMEQNNANFQFREVAEFLESIRYFHYLPRIIQHPPSFNGPATMDDPYGHGFLERIVRTPEGPRRARLDKIEQALRVAAPGLTRLTDARDEKGSPHLEAVFGHWRPDSGEQAEDQFSDGMLRLIAMLWSILEGDSPLLMEEPEQSLHSGIVSRLPGLMWQMRGEKQRQIIASVHSPDFLMDKGIGGEEALLLIPDHEGTRVESASSIKEIRTLLESGLSVAEAALPWTEPKNIMQLGLIDE